MNSEAGSQMKKRTAPLNFLNFVFFYVMYFLALILIALLPKGKKINDTLAPHMDLQVLD